MEREMKARAWDTDTESYVESGFDFRIDGNGRVYRRAWGESVWDCVNNLIIEFATGRKDSKRTEEFPEGHEIYDGDILKFKHRGKILIGKVFQTVTGEWNVSAGTIGETTDLYYGRDGMELEVIGNKREHPQLLSPETPPIE